MLRTGEVPALYGSLQADEKRKFLSDLLEKFQETSDNFRVIRQFVSERPAEADEAYLDEIFGTVVETLEEIDREAADEAHDQVRAIAEKIRVLEREDLGDNDESALLMNLG